MFNFLKDKERVVTNSCDLAALNDIFGEFISVQMENMSAIYIVETISPFGQGSKKQSDNYQESHSPNLTVLSDRGVLDKDGLVLLCKMLCDYANCPEKANRIINEYLN